MAEITFHKVKVLPGVLQSDALYAVERPNSEYVLIATSDDGDPFVLQSSSEFLRPPDLVDQTDQTYFYCGWQFDTSWQIQRQVRSTGQTERAATGYPTLADAWSDRDTISYG